MHHSLPYIPLLPPLPHDANTFLPHDTNLTLSLPYDANLTLSLPRDANPNPSNDLMHHLFPDAIMFRVLDTVTSRPK